MFLDQIHNFLFKKPQSIATEDLMASLLVMAWVVESKDPYTGGHLWRVSRYAYMTSQSLGLDKKTVERVALGGFLHDLGKIGIPDAILNKPSYLSEDEIEIIRTHPDIGVRILAGHPLSYLVSSVIKSHHERQDGLGYPNQLKGHEIPVDAKIVGICDAFDAMTSTRPYRKAFPISDALKIIEENKDTQFDANLVNIFLDLGKSDAFQNIVGFSDDGIPLFECPMCGPTIVLRKTQIDNSKVYCRKCRAEFIASKNGSNFKINPTGLLGRPKDLDIEPDLSQIKQLVKMSAGVLCD